MTGSTGDGKPGDAARFMYGPRPVGALLPALTRAVFRKRSPATAALLAEWEIVVGPAIAAVSTPRKLSAGTLAIGCTGPIAMELQHLSAALIGRINTHFGQDLVTRLRFMQEAPAATMALPVPPPPPVVVPPAVGVGVPTVKSVPFRSVSAPPVRATDVALAGAGAGSLPGDVRRRRRGGLG